MEELFGGGAQFQRASVHDVQESRQVNNRVVVGVSQPA